MEFSYASASVTMMRAALDEHGAVLLRGVVPSDQVAGYGSALDHVYACYDAGDQRFGEFAPEETKGVSQGDVSPRMFERFSNLKFDDYFAHAKLSKLIDLYLSNAHADLCNFISMSPTTGRAQRRIPMHTDGIIQGTEAASVTFWSPLHECGVNAPGLCVIPAGRTRVLHYLRKRFPGKQLPGWSSTTEWANTGAFDQASLEREFGPAFVPAMQPGDVMAFSNWTIHGSYVTEAMRARRSAIIQRWLAKAWGKEAAWFSRQWYNFKTRNMRKRLVFTAA